MISKPDFVKAIKAIKYINDRLDKDVKTYELRLAFCKYSLQDNMISLLESAMGVEVDPSYGSIISWWIYDNDFGRKHLTVSYNNQKQEIETPEELYDFIVVKNKINTKKEKRK